MAKKEKKKKYSKKNFLLDIVVPVFGEWALAKNALASIPAAMEGSDESYRILLLDNGTPPFQMSDGSTQVSPAAQSEECQRMLDKSRGDKFFRLDQNQGYPGGLNYIVSQGKAPLILVLSADIVMKPGFITTMLKEMDDPTVGVVGAKLLFPEENSPNGPAGTVQHAGHAVKIDGSIYHIFITWPADHPKVNIRREVQSVTGAVFMTRRPIWESIGGLNQEYGAGTYEDVEYCLTVREHGKKVIYNPAACAYHYVGGSISQGAMPKNGFALANNANIFKGRWANRNLAWDEWSYY